MEQSHKARESSRTAGRTPYDPCRQPSQCDPARGSPAAASGLELDFDENEFEIVGIYDVVLDPGLAGIGNAGPQRRRHRRLAVEDMQLTRGDGHHDIVVIVTVPPRVTSRREALFRHDDAVVLGLDRGLGEGAFGLGHVRKLMLHAMFVR